MVNETPLKKLEKLLPLGKGETSTNYQFFGKTIPFGKGETSTNYHFLENYPFGKGETSTNYQFLGVPLLVFGVFWEANIPHDLLGMVLFVLAEFLMGFPPVDVVRTTKKTTGKTKNRNLRPTKIGWWIKGSFWTYLVGGFKPFEKY